jgi:penicillin-binding protein 1A
MSFLRGEYDPKTIERLKSLPRRARALGKSFLVRAGEAAEPVSRDRPPADRSIGSNLHRFVLTAGIIGLISALIAALSIPGLAFISRVVGSVSSRFAAGPAGKVVLPEFAQRSVILAADGSVIATLAGEQNRRVVTIAEVPPLTREAVISIEDARFYSHRGIDATGLARAILSNAKAGRLEEGGSTITQQLVKNLFVGPEKTLDRKIREAQYAVALERSMTKSQILELYLNETYFGEGAYGIGAAAEFYFGKPVGQLSVAESALLAGVIRAPERFGPFASAKAALERRNLVLRRMAAEGYIKDSEAARLSKTPLGAKRHPLPQPIEPYFVEFIKEQIQSDPAFGETRADRARAIFQGGLRISTTLDLKLQTAARQAVAAVLTSPKTDPSSALVSIDPRTGAVKAMVGGRDFNALRYDLAVQGTRPAGSAFKPFTMVAALEAGVSPGFTQDTPSPVRLVDAEGKEWTPANYSHRSEGAMDMRRATELSVNTYYAQLINKIGPEKVVDMAHKLGITSHLDPYLSLALGTFDVSPFEMASAYATLANGGVRCRPFAMTRVTNPTGKVIFRADPSCSRVIDGTIAAQATAILQGVIERGTGRRNGKLPGRPAAGKTGTTEDYADAWFMGFTRQFSTAVWMGYPESTKRKLHNIHGYPRVFGGSLPAMIWNRFMRAAHTGLPVLTFPKPPPAVAAVVPDLAAKTQQEATAAVEAAGLTPYVQIVPSALPAGIVAGQSPAPGYIAEAGNRVTIQISDGSGLAPPPPPNPSPSPSPFPD